MRKTDVLDGESNELDQETGSRKSVELSVVIPISERYDDLKSLHQRYARELTASGHSFEFIFVLDGPNHDALRVLKELKAEYSEVRLVTLNRWVGEATALSVGFEKAEGRIIITVSSYIQVEPQEIHKMLKLIEGQEVDLVISWRHPRIDSLFNRLQSWTFHYFIRILTGVKFHDISCGLRVMKREVAEQVHVYGDLHRFFPLLVYRSGFRIEEVPVKQSSLDTKRRIHQPGVYLRRLLDILTLFFLFKFTKKPLRFFGLVGSGLFGSGGIIIAYLGLYRVLGMGAIAGRPLLILGILFLVLGVQLFSIGLLGELIIFTHARKMKDYRVDKFLGEIQD